MAMSPIMRCRSGEMGSAIGLLLSTGLHEPAILTGMSIGFDEDSPVLTVAQAS